MTQDRINWNEDELQVVKFYTQKILDKVLSEQVVVSDDGKISIFSIGRLMQSVDQSELEDEIARRQIEKGLSDL